MPPLRDALGQLERIETFCVHCENLPAPPVTLPPDPVRAAGLDPEIWHGLGLVGVWAAIDAYVERKGIALRGQSLIQRLGELLPQNFAAVVFEMWDLRNLYAHNFGGIADDRYFRTQRRYTLHAGQACRLIPGAAFDGERVALTLEHLRYYLERAREILAALDALG